MKKIANLLFCVIFCLLIISAPFQATASSAAASVEFTDELRCTSVQLTNLNTGTVVFEKEPTAEVEPVFLTKLMIALLTLESISPNQTVPASSGSSSPSSAPNTSSQQEALDASVEAERSRRQQVLEDVKITAPDYIFTALRDAGSSAPNIRQGEILDAYQLLNLLLVTSGNDAAMILADYLGKGSIPDCVDAMNERAKQLGCTNTFFTNVHGFHDPEQITTVHDIYKITAPLLLDDLFMTIAESVTYTLEPTNQSDDRRTYRTTNLMIDNSGGGYYYQPIKGIKTGRTDSSGFCFLGYADWNGTQYLCIAMGAPIYDEHGNMKSNGAFKDTQALCSWALNNLEIKTIVEREQPVMEIPLKYAWNTDRMLLVTDEEFTAIVPKNVDMKSVMLLPDDNIPEELEAPVEAGQNVGTAKVVYANKELGHVRVVTGTAVERNTMQAISDVLDSVFSSAWIIAAGVVFVLILLAYGLSFILKNRKNRRKVNRSRGYNRPRRFH